MITLSKTKGIVWSISSCDMELCDVEGCDVEGCDAEELFSWNESPSFFVPEFSPDSKKVVSEKEDGLILIWDLDEGQHLLKPLLKPSCALGFSPDCTKLAVSTIDGTIDIWDLATEQVTHRLESLDARMQTFNFSPDGRKVAFGDFSGTVQVWDLHSLSGVTQSSGPLKSHAGKGGYLDEVTVSPDGQKVLIQFSEMLEIRNTATGAVEQRLTGKPDSSTAFSPDSRCLAVLSHDRLEVLDIVKRRVDRVIEGHRYSVILPYFPCAFHNKRKTRRQALNAIYGQLGEHDHRLLPAHLDQVKINRTAMSLDPNNSPYYFTSYPHPIDETEYEYPEDADDWPEFDGCANKNAEHLAICLNRFLCRCEMPEEDTYLPRFAMSSWASPPS
ncbi:WD40 repeat domain-containing protein [Aspergillus affinis]|uniref:WD40 repeat domain-containing protein n=1 Tax=Aspergillus affinis TaxID=1070780 RepID=UPI0022FEF487|nr:uncharacterized protein KD926_004665 [Aspergillus affinis]KAI9035064.1 hypothetical protein KD926_004665 [Aspergillus affinis]